MARTPKASPRQRAKIATVLGEYKDRTLQSSSGAPVTTKPQALAIALSEAGLSRPKPKRNKP